jgi:hypothetical protein
MSGRVENNKPPSCIVVRAGWLRSLPSRHVHRPQRSGGFSSTVRMHSYAANLQRGLTWSACIFIALLPAQAAHECIRGI